MVASSGREGLRTIWWRGSRMNWRKRNMNWPERSKSYRTTKLRGGTTRLGFAGTLVLAAGRCRSALKARFSLVAPASRTLGTALGVTTVREGLRIDDDTICDLLFQVCDLALMT